MAHTNFLLCCGLSFVTTISALAQTPEPQNPPRPARANSASGGLQLQFTAAPLSEVIELYQQLTTKRVIRDPQIENATVTIETNGTLSKDEAIEFIDKSLLLAGYAFVPSGDMLKVIAFDSGKLPSSEGVPMILNREALPDTDQVVSFVLPFKYLDAEKAAQAFSQIIPNHAYGRIIAIPNASALVITENSNTIRAYIELAEQVDVPPTEVKHKTIFLERADAEEVAQQLTEILGLGQASSSGSAPNQPPINLQRPINPQQALAQTSNMPGSLGGTEAIAAAPKIQAIQRTNTLLIVARPLDIEYIESLVEEYDAASPQRSFISRKLRYMDVSDFVNVAKDALLRGAKDQSGGNSFQGGNNNQTTSTTSQARNSRGSSSSGMGGNTMSGGGTSDFGGMGGGSSGGGGSGMSSSLEESSQASTQSVLIGKTLLIMDPPSSQFFASGPPEQLRVLNELADELDKRPKQIMLSAIIGEFTLGSDFNFGLDWIRTLGSVGGDNLVGGVLNTQGTAFNDITKLTGVEDYLPALGGLTVYGQIGKHLNVFLHTLESTNRFHVLQKPTITTLNHKKAAISIGQSLAIPGQSLTVANGVSDGASVATTTQYIEAVLELNIVPHIYANDEVRLDFEQINRDVSGYTTIGGNRVPNLSTQSLRNTIIVPNGSTVLLGGLITERDTNNKSGLPFLVRVPILKHLFGNTSKIKERRELMIFVQPHVMESDADHLNQQQDLVRNTESYQKNKAFAEPNANEASPLLPLPTWQEQEAKSIGKKKKISNSRVPTQK